MIAELFAKLRGLKINIQLVNDTLDIQAPKGVLDAALINEIKENKAELIQFIKTYKNKKDDFNAIEAVPQQESYVLSSSQRRLWILSQFEAANVAYNMSATYIFVGEFNRQALEYAFKKLIERHESLRTVFKANSEGEVRQYIRPVDDTGFHIAEFDLKEVMKQWGPSWKHCCTKRQKRLLIWPQAPWYGLPCTTPGKATGCLATVCTISSAMAGQWASCSANYWHCIAAMPQQSPLPCHLCAYTIKIMPFGNSGNCRAKTYNSTVGIGKSNLKANCPYCSCTAIIPGPL
jgi:Condensation domain/TubC N-terminal docking domain